MAEIARSSGGHAAGRGVQSVDRAFRLLETLGSLGGEAGLSELQTVLELPLPTVHRLLRALVETGSVVQLASRRYALGPVLLRLGEAAGRTMAVWVRPVLERLERASGETANLAILDGDMAAYIAQVPSRHAMRMFTEVGHRVHVHSTGVGKALLAQLPDEQVLALVRRTGLPAFTESTVRSEAALLRDLTETRARGYAVDDCEQEVGVRCYAIGFPGPMPSAVSVSGPSARLPFPAPAEVIAALRAAQAELASPPP